MDIQELNKMYDIYLEDYDKHRKNTSLEEVKYFKSLQLDTTKSYLIQSTNEDMMNKLVTYYLVKNNDLKSFETHAAFDFVIQQQDKYGCASDILILYYHINTIDYTEKSSNWVTKTLLNTITGRNRSGRTTIVLTEKALPNLESSNELIHLKLPNILPKIIPNNKNKQKEDHKPEEDKTPETSTTIKKPQFIPKIGNSNEDTNNYQ